MNRPVISRTAFDKLPPHDRMTVAKTHQIINDPEPKQVKVSDPDVLTRAEYDALSPEGRSAAVRDKRRVVDGERVKEPEE